MAEQTDHNGNAIPADEPDDCIITIWEIEPHYDNDYDILWARSYQDACDHAQRVLDSLMDDDTKGDEWRTLRVRTRKVHKSEYRQATNDDN